METLIVLWRKGDPVFDRLGGRRWRWWWFAQHQARKEASIGRGRQHRVMYREVHGQSDNLAALLHMRTGMLVQARRGSLGARSGPRKPTRIQWQRPSKALRRPVVDRTCAPRSSNVPSDISFDPKIEAVDGTRGSLSVRGARAEHASSSLAVVRGRLRSDRGAAHRVSKHAPHCAPLIGYPQSPCWITTSRSLHATPSLCPPPCSCFLVLFCTSSRPSFCRGLHWGWTHLCLTDERKTRSTAHHASSQLPAHPGALDRYHGQERKWECWPVRHKLRSAPGRHTRQPW